jgi:hypothetical protein
MWTDGLQKLIVRRFAAACVVVVLLLCFSLGAVAQTAPKQTCTVKPTDFDGWKAQEMSNDWVKLVFVPQLGGRLMQVTFAGHAYLFVNPQFKGKYIPPPSDPTGKWFNYGGDKLWPMPEGDEDANHWPGPIADQLDDGTYTFRTYTIKDKACAVQMVSPPDPRTGLQYTRDISIAINSPEIHFSATMTNISDHPIQWSVQAVSQYDLYDAQNSATYNKNFWAFAPVNPNSAYFKSFEVRAGLADDPSFEVRDGLFSLHWLFLQNEVWLDSPGGWVAVLDRASHFAMVEHFDYHEHADYPGKATVIFYKNGPSFGADKNGMPSIHTDENGDPFYMEAELNSPIVKLAPREAYTMQTIWSPTRTGDGFKTIEKPGTVEQPLTITNAAGTTRITGTFGVFNEGTLTAIFYDAADKALARTELGPARPDQLVKLDHEITVPTGTDRVELHFMQSGYDRGELGAYVLSGQNGGTR